MKLDIVLRPLFVLAALLLSVAYSSAQTEWTYVVTGKAGKEGVPVYDLGGNLVDTLKKGDEIWISTFYDEYPLFASPNGTRKAVVFTEAMEDYVLFIEEDGIIVPKSQYRFDRIFSGLGDVVNKDGSKTKGAAAFGLLYIVLMFFIGAGIKRSESDRYSVGWVFFGFFMLILLGETYFMMTHSRPFWFLSFSEVGFFKGIFFLLLMIGYLYLKYMVTVGALYQFHNTELLEDSEYEPEKALLVTVVGTWLILSMVYWKSDIAVYLMAVVGIATVAGVIYVMRKAFRQAGVLVSLCILVTILISGASLCYVACEILAKIIQIIVACYCVYALISGLSSGSSGSSSVSDHTVYVDYDGNAHDLYRQSDGTYLDYKDNSRWNRIGGANSDRFDRIF